MKQHANHGRDHVPPKYGDTDGGGMDPVAGMLYLPSGAETDGQILTRDSSSDHGIVWSDPAASPAAVAYEVHVKVFDDEMENLDGNGIRQFMVPTSIDGWVLTAVAAYITTVSTIDDVDVMIRNVTTGQDMLSTRIRIDEGDYVSYTAGTPPVIDGTQDVVNESDIIAIDVDAGGVDAKGLGVILTFEAP